jgi:SAM-dependent methyltransferase
MKRVKWIAGVIACGMLGTAALAQEGRGDVVYVPTPQIVVDTMLDLAKISGKDYLIDLGSGDGRIPITAAQKLGAHGMGVDLDTYLLKKARENAAKAKVDDKVKFVEEDLFETDLSKATVITSYLLPELNLKLRPRVMALKPGTRLVAHDYHFGEWDPEEQRELVVPGKKVGNPGISYVFYYVVPARVPGKWQSLVNIGGRDTPVEFNLQQEFQEVEGSVDIRDRKVKIGGRLLGEQIRLVVPPAKGTPRYEFSGRVTGDRIDGSVIIGEGARRQTSAWNARQVQRGELKRASDEVTP